MSEPAVKKTALVTGSTSGIGLACARALAKHGVNLIVTGFADEPLINSIVSELKGYGVEAHYVAADLSKVTEIESLWSEATRLFPDGIDILINNAGFAGVNRVEDISDSEWNAHNAVMLNAPFYLIKRCLPSMRKKSWGRIINTSSGYGLVGAPFVTAYVTVKHGLIGMTKSVALETASFGVTCNAICPGVVDTPLSKAFLSQVALISGASIEQVQANAFSPVPSGTSIKPEQIAELAEFLCFSNASSQMTGAAYLIDYGLTAQ